MIEQELNQHPFSLLSEAGRRRLQEGTDLAYFQPEDIILDAASTSDSVFVVHKGCVAGRECAGQPSSGEYLCRR